MEIIQFFDASLLKNDSLRDRAKRAKVRNSREFIALVDNSEVAFLSFEDRSDISTGVVYEILVLPQFRNRGVGSALLSHAESLASTLNCSRVRLTVNAFDRTVEQSWLEAWYADRGYIPASDGSREHEKKLPENVA